MGVTTLSKPVSHLSRLLTCASASVLALGLAGSALAQEAPIVQPGAPGQAGKTLTSEEAVQIADTSYSPADVAFMTNMIPHHNQAVQMANLVEGRSSTPELVEIANKIKASQADEIEFMQDWLRARSEPVPDPTAHQDMDMSHEMAGMASPAEMLALSEASGTAFDRQFLTLMIAHHEGALTMVEQLQLQPGSAYDPILFDFTIDIVNDQTSEIVRMNGLLVGLSEDPRAGLAAGFRDAGTAAMNLTVLASLPKPAGFFDPTNPSGLPPVISKDEAEEVAAEIVADGAEAHAGHEGHDMAAEDAEEAVREPEDEQSNEDTEWGVRSPLLSFCQHGYGVFWRQDGGRQLSRVQCLQAER